MANNCYFEMKAQGKKEDLEKLYNILTYKDNDYFLYRIFSADIVEEEKIRYIYAVIVRGLFILV